jgi:hypothetical protein
MGLRDESLAAMIQKFTKLEKFIAKITCLFRNLPQWH